MRFSRIFGMDGNNSLKRMAMLANRVVGDTRVLDDSSYFLSHEFVNRFANEVRGRQTKNHAVKSRRPGDLAPDLDDSDDSDDSDAESVEGDPTDGIFPRSATRRPAPTGSTVPEATTTSSLQAAPLPASSPPSASADAGAAAAANASDAGASVSSDAAAVASTSTSGVSTSDEVDEKLRQLRLQECVKNWKAASADEKKKMWAMFEESGIFASACRHGCILWLADMVRSGEL